MSAPLIELVDVSIARDGRILLKNVNWTIHCGEHWALIGPSGSGKTSMAEVLAGTRRTLRGQVRYSFAREDAPPHGSVMLLSAESQMETRANLSPYYQARWNSSDEENSATVRYFLSAQGIYGMSEFHVLSEDDVPREFHDWRRVAVDVTGVAPLLERKLVDLSNGELRKVLLARALAQKPRLLILDDPLSGLDETSRKAFHRFVRAADRLRVGLVFVASGLADLPAGCATRVVQINGRRINCSGRISAVRLRSDIRRNRIRGQRPMRRAGVEGRVVIELNKVSVKYGRVRVLKEVSWQVRQGERWAVLGPNGSGKTTLLGLILADNPQAYASDVRIFGRARGSGQSIWDIKRRIGHVAPEIQSFLPPDQTGEMVVCSGFYDSIGLYRRCSAAVRRAAVRVMRSLRIANLAMRRLGEMSSGEQRLVLIARALVKKPEILILDEPCQGLDAETRKRTLALVDHVVGTGGVTLIVVAHRPCDLPRSITHILHLSRGRTEAITQKPLFAIGS